MSTEVGDDGESPRKSARFFVYIISDLELISRDTETEFLDRSGAYSLVKTHLPHISQPDNAF
jgi:hypothetical protein